MRNKKEMDKRVDEILASLEKLTSELRASLGKKAAPEWGGPEIVTALTPFKSENYVYILAREGKIPHRRIGRYVEFSRREIVAWVVDGCPKDAQEWAEKYRAKNERKQAVA